MALRAIVCASVVGSYAHRKGKTIDITVRQTEYEEIEPLRALYRQQSNCQIVRDSILRRGLADPYLILMDERIAGYAGVWNEHHVHRVMEFYTVPERRGDALPMFRELLSVSRATHFEAQTNMPLMVTMLYDCAVDISEENILFEDGPATHLSIPGAAFRRRETEDDGPEGEWVVELHDAVVAGGGVLDHYNPPYGDIYMEVAAEVRRQGIGAYLVQELRSVCYTEGKKPAARCKPDNEASRRTLQRGGLLPCGRLLAGRVNVPEGG